MNRRNGFTLIELLIVIGLLAALASVFFSHFTGSREEVAHNPIIQKELADIQRAFHRMAVDCVLQRDTHYLKIAQYGLAPLMANTIAFVPEEAAQADWMLPTWDEERGRGWRGPYVAHEGYREIDPQTVGQQSGNIQVPVLTTPNSDSATDIHYYRVLAVDEEGIVLNPSDRLDVSLITQFWVVYPLSDRFYGNIDTIPEAYRRRLLIND